LEQLIRVSMTVIIAAEGVAARASEPSSTGSAAYRCCASAVGWLYVVLDTGKGATPSVMAAFACAVHDRQSAAHQEYYRGGDQ